MKIISLIIYYFFAKHLPSSSMPFGKISNLLRRWICRFIFKKIQNNCVIKRGVYFGTGYNIIIGENSQLGENCRIPNNIIIGDNVMMGFEGLYLGVKHKTSDLNIPFINQGYENVDPITIKDNVWIGARVIVLPGIKIEKNCIIAAGSILTKDTKPNSVYAGVPAKKIKNI
jgi:maltose O-acetyltransferase|tara:strand:+ start:854 stop:1366 length:513 start_codon:yes stop_codon:yes gene_type:complete